MKHVIEKETILIDAKFFHALLDDINNAKKSILLETYIFENDKLGQTILNALCDAAKRGVKVKILIDGFGSKDWLPEMSDKLLASGGHVRIYHPLPWKFYHWKFSSYFKKSILKAFIYFFKVINSRNHRKTCIIDKKIAYIGSANISAYHKSQHSSKWHDINIRIEGTTKELEQAFYCAWHGITPKTKPAFFYKKLAIYRLNNTKKKRKFLFNDLLSKVHSSKKRIWIINPFFISHFSFVKALKKAAKSGVDVRILVPSYSDVAIIPFLTKYYYHYFSKSNVKLLEYPDHSILHCKVVIIDDWFCIGSSNFNNRSLIHDLEIDVSLQTSSAQSTLEYEVKKHFDISKSISPKKLGKHSLFFRIIGRLLILIKHWC